MQINKNEPSFEKSWLRACIDTVIGRREGGKEGGREGEREREEENWGQEGRYMYEEREGRRREGGREKELIITLCRWKRPRKSWIEL